MTQCQKLARDPATREVWSTAFGNEFGQMAQGDNKTGTKGKQCTVYLITHGKIANIPEDRVVTYARIGVDFRSQKSDPN